MATGILTQFEKQIKKWVDRCFRDPNMLRTVTYSLYKGRTEDVESFDIPAICVAHVVGNEEMLFEVNAQQGKRKYIIREIDLPTGVTIDSLTRNDVITDAETDFAVVEINKTLEFVIELTCTGTA